MTGQRVAGSSDYTGGLVGRIQGDSTIAGAVLTGQNITGGDFTGGLAGESTGSAVQRVVLSGGQIVGGTNVGGLFGMFSGGLLHLASADAAVQSSGNQTGGLAGQVVNLADLRQVYSTGSVSGSYSTGGLAGFVGGGSVIADGYSRAAVSGGQRAGGFAGQLNASTISRCYSTGAVNGWSAVGGFLGLVSGGQVNYSYWDTQTSGPSSSSAGTGRTTEQMQQQASYETWDFDTIWWIQVGADYPRHLTNPRQVTVLAQPETGGMVSGGGTYEHGQNATVIAEPAVGFRFESWTENDGVVSTDLEYTFEVTSDRTLTANFTPLFPGGDGSADHPFHVGSAEQLDMIRLFPDKHFSLSQSVDLDVEPWNQGQGWIPVGTESTPFSGTVDGGGNVINGLFLNRPDDSRQGLFGSTHNATIKNLALTNIDITGMETVGGLVGNYTGGTISGCYVTGTVKGNNSKTGGLVGQNTGGTISESYFVGAVSGTNEVGGIVGENQDDGTISNSYATGTVSGTGSDVGGLVGVNQSGEINNCYSTNEVSGNRLVGGLVGYFFRGSVNSCYATGDVSGNADATGGLVGSIYQGEVIDSYATGLVEGDNKVGGLVGYISNSGSVTNSYATGAVTGNEDFGGLVGSRLSGTVTNSFWDTQTSELTTSADGTGKTTTQMRLLATFADAGWDIEEATDAYTGQPYPGLRMEAGKAWQIMASYAVTYDANQATGGNVPGPQVKFHDEPLSLSHNTGDLVRTGSNFSGWNTQANGNGTDYAEGATYPVNASVTLYAKWTAATYGLTVNNGSGSGQYAVGTVVNIQADPPAAGRIFDKWVGDVADVNSASTTVTMPASNITVTATYKDLPPTNYSLAVSSVGASGVTITGNQSIYGGTTNYTLPRITPGTEIILAAPAVGEGAPFVSWTGCDATNQSARTCTVTMNGNKSVTATYGGAKTSLPGVLMLLLDE
ncbi:S-layer family protein [Desulfonatronum sp. SC1]|uniref:beta strand repeat-containing protein n=1 Tax=Desulfonatronum sp. SC1 TaxID=2109626 RepID=UPI000D305D76|nr:GLUG motif-containing protein [Desulfonatronum sp. SC1]PTN31444.1 hypothetical protein C6366_18135 [Desulfonatronum sp. SC1]